MLPRTHVKLAPALLVGIVSSIPVAGQSPSPPLPERVFQDELDLQANANFVQGSGARAFGMGGAFLARADDATAASWNPAGLSYLKAPEFSFVFQQAHFDGRRTFGGFETLFRDSVQYDFNFDQDTRDRRSGGVPEFIAFTWPWEAGDASGAVQVGFQRVVPFTSSRTIEDTRLGTITNRETGETSGRSDSTRRTVDSTGGFDILSFGAGVRVTRKLRIGFTLNRWMHGYEQTVLKRDQTVPSRQESEMDISGWNAHLGAILSLSDSLNLGVVYKTGLAADATLKRVRYDEFPASPNLEAKTNFNLYARDDVGLSLPGAAGVGLSWRPRSNLTLSLDYTRTNWSDGRIRNFFALPRATYVRPVDRPAPDPLESRNFCGEYPVDYRPIPRNPCPPVLPYPTLNPSIQQADTKQARVGIEYVIIKRRIKWPVRAGYFRDGQFFPSIEGDAPTFDGFTLGTGLILGSVLFDVAYVYESGRYTDGNILVDEDNGRVLRQAGDNDVKSHKFYASIIYRLSRRP